MPPFADIDRPVLGVHILQAVARQVGKEVRILYANLALAARIGVERYNTIGYASIVALLGERCFAPAARRRIRR